MCGGKAPPDDHEHLRVFFALWPDAATANRLHALARALQLLCGGRVMRRDTLHLTLAFLGEVPTVALESVLRLGRQIRGEAFALTVDVAGSWHGNRVVWAAPSTPPGALQALAAQLCTGVRNAGLALDERAFNPHVTLLRKAHDAPPAGPVAPVHWQVASFALVASERTAQGASYRTLARWRLHQ